MKPAQQRTEKNAEDILRAWAHFAAITPIDEDQKMHAEATQALFAKLERAKEALRFYANTESVIWDHATVPPRLKPAMGYGPNVARAALRDLGEGQ